MAKDRNLGTSRRKTRGSEALAEDAKGNVTVTVPENLSGGAMRKKLVPHEAHRVVRSVGKQKEKILSPVVVDVVFGGLQSSIADLEELRRKREEDALKCGKRVRTIGDSLNDKQGPSKSKTLALNIDSTPEEFLDSDNDIEKTSTTKHGPRIHQGNRPFLNESLEKDLQVQEMELSPQLVEYRKKCLPQSKDPAIQSRDLTNNKREEIRRVSLVQGNVDVQCHTQSERTRTPQIALTKKSHRLRSLTPPPSSKYGMIENDSRNDTNFRGDVPERLFESTIASGSRIPMPHSSVERLYAVKGSDPVDNRYRNPLPSSPIQSRQNRRGIFVTRSESRSPSLSSIPSSTKEDLQTGRVDDHRKNISRNAISPSSANRRRRCYKFAVREGKRSERQVVGKKPFYLTLNGEGVPYGLGRPAWIAEVNKLAAWLDPSCTHIRKQTHEDMCILKDRLNDHFEYSGELNQDFLRGLLGKGVTIKRTELIAYMKRGGKQSVSFDEDIWKKLEKLAKSQQREERTEHARFANGCRWTLGRASASGVHGVRERLEMLHGRSPDPDEVAEEMQRPKGFGKKDLEEHRVLKRKNMEIDDNHMEDDYDQYQSPETMDKRNRDDGQNVRRNSRQLLALKENDEDQVTAASKMRRGKRVVVDSIDGSKDKYIAELEAELRSFRSGNTRTSSFVGDLVDDRARDYRDDNEGGLEQYTGDKDNGRRLKRTELHSAVDEEYNNV